MKKAIIIILCLAMLIPCMTICVTAEESEKKEAYEVFTDVDKEAWYYKYVNTAYSGFYSNFYGVYIAFMDGTSETTFEPDRPITREEFVTIYYRIKSIIDKDLDAFVEGLPDVPFTDVSQNEWYSNAIKYAYNRNLINGVGDNKFGIGQYITREDVAVFLYADVAHQTPEECVVNDIDEVSYYAKEAVIYLTSYLYISNYWSLSPPNNFNLDPLFVGNENGDFMPHDYLTRAQAAAVYLKLLNGNYYYSGDQKT